MESFKIIYIKNINILKTRLYCFLKYFDISNYLSHIYLIFGIILTK